MQLTELQMPNATRMQLMIRHPDKVPQPCMGQLMGYRCDHSVLVFLPKKPLLMPRQDLKVEVRVGLQSAIVRFDAVILEVHQHPYLYLHLSFPASVTVEQQLRQASRFAFDHSLIATLSEEVSMNGQFVDISLSGARINFNERLPAQTASVTLSISVSVADIEQSLELTASIKSAPTDDASAPFLYGVAFTNVVPAQRVILQALCFELQVLHGSS